MASTAVEKRRCPECASSLAGLDFNDPLATTDGLSSDSETGYYTFTAVAQDNAGNKSEPIVRTAVNDGEVPRISV